MKKALFALILGLAAAPAAWACALNDMNCQGWYHNEYLPQQQQRAQQQYTPVQYEARYGTVVQADTPEGPTFSTRNRTSREQADDDALRGCQEAMPSGVHCKVIHRYANTCIGLVRDTNRTTLYTGVGLSKWKARRAGMKECKKFHNSCEEYMTACSLPVRIN